MNAATTQIINTLTGHTCAVVSIAWSPDGSKLVTGSKDGTTRVWSASTGQLLNTVPLTSFGAQYSLSWNNNGSQYAALDSATNIIHIQDANTGQLLNSNKFLREHISSVVWSSDGTKLLTGDWEDKITIWDATTGQVIISLDNQHSGSVYVVAWSPNGSKFATTGTDNTIRVWNTSTGQQIIAIQNTTTIHGLTWASTNKLITSDSTNTVRVWDANTGAQLLSFAYAGQLFAITSSPDGTKVVYGGAQGFYQESIVSINFLETPIPTPSPTPYPCPCTLFGTSVPANPSNIGNPPAVNLGVVFKPSVNGQVTGIRFYKLAGNGGTHKGYLWSATGTQLGTVTFTGETATGWQTATFATPINVTANTVYVASYHAPQGRFAYDNNTFTTGRTVLPLYALATGETSPGNGTYIFGAAGLFPNATFNATNYWVDVVFSPT
ncbi:MAG: DUF4082 domain-containing protein [Anaerolineae bacterium]|nr:DUF4082 domain-containing protein [Anaerolineae bacterium]